MFMMNQSAIPLWSPGFWERLVELKHLSGGIPVCPGPRFGFGAGRGSPGAGERLCPAAYDIPIPASGPAEYQFDTDLKVYCTVHGRAAGMEERAAQARGAAYDPVYLVLLDHLERWVLVLAGALLSGVVGLFLFRRLRVRAEE